MLKENQLSTILLLALVGFVIYQLMQPTTIKNKGTVTVEESEEEDMEALRALLENIITLSFDEEELMANLRATESQDPRYVTHGKTQRFLKDGSKMVADSLFELSLRVRQLAGAVNREIGLVNHHMDKALVGFADRRTSEIDEP